jgi:hypothetical protein
MNATKLSRHLQAAVLMLGGSLVSAADSTAAPAADQRRPDCRVTENTVSAVGAAYEAPRSAKLADLPVGARYLVMATFRHADGETWLLLTSPSGAHIGWVTEKSVKRLVVVSCTTAGFLTRAQGR